MQGRGSDGENTAWEFSPAGRQNEMLRNERKTWADVQGGGGVKGRREGRRGGAFILPGYPGATSS